MCPVRGKTTRSGFVIFTILPSSSSVMPPHYVAGPPPPGGSDAAEALTFAGGHSKITARTPYMAGKAGAALGLRKMVRVGR
ncbi:hypothetical protein GCM10027612_62120 [Microbispora bryophytorum subsp. camponoti]